MIINDCVRDCYATCYICNARKLKAKRRSVDFNKVNIVQLINKIKKDSGMM